MIPFTGATRLISGQPYNCTSNANLVLSTNQVDYGNSGNKILIGSPLGNLSGQYDEFECSPVFLFHKRRNRAKTRCLWDASIRSPLAEISQRPLRNISKDIFFERSLRRLKYISKKMSFCDVFKESQKFSKRWFCDVLDTSQKYILKVFVTIQKYPTKMVLYWYYTCMDLKNSQKMKRRFLEAMHSQ